MSNIGRPRVGLRACAYCTSTSRDSNGQCHCRNVLYRVTRGLAKTTAEKVVKHYNAALKSFKGDIEKALADTREEYPSIVKARKAPADHKVKASKPKAEKKTAAQKKAAVKKAETIIDEAVAKIQDEAPAADPAKSKAYLLVVDDFEETGYARKDAAVKNGIRSGKSWVVKRNGKIVAQSDDLL